MATEYTRPLRGRKPVSKSGAFNPYAAGDKTYEGGRPFPNVGKVGAKGKAGYAQRDARRQAVLRRGVK